MWTDLTVCIPVPNPGFLCLTILAILLVGGWISNRYRGWKCEECGHYFVSRISIVTRAENERNAECGRNKCLLPWCRHVTETYKLL
jgi:hypothetical protein